MQFSNTILIPLMSAINAKASSKCGHLLFKCGHHHEQDNILQNATRGTFNHF